MVVQEDDKNLGSRRAVDLRLYLALEEIEESMPIGSLHYRYIFFYNI